MEDNADMWAQKIAIVAEEKTRPLWFYDSLLTKITEDRNALQKQLEEEQRRKV